MLLKAPPERPPESKRAEAQDLDDPLLKSKDQLLISKAPNLLHSLTGPLLPVRIELRIGQTRQQGAAAVDVGGSANLVPQSFLATGGVDVPMKDGRPGAIDLSFTFIDREAVVHRRRFVVVPEGLDETIILAGSPADSGPGSHDAGSLPSSTGSGGLAANQKSLLLRQGDNEETTTTGQVEPPEPPPGTAGLRGADDPPDYESLGHVVTHGTQLVVPRDSTALTATSAGVSFQGTEVRGQSLAHAGRTVEENQPVADDGRVHTTSTEHPDV